MCGIIGYIGTEDCANLILEGLRRLEYRGYDSAGIAIITDGRFEIRRAAGKLDRLAEALRGEPVSGTIGIGHTRWATHGPPTELNAHPHRAGDVVVVHNGIIENHRVLKAELLAEGHTFSSETDTEIVAHLVSRERGRGHGLVEAVRLALLQVHGAYAIAALDRTDPETLVAAKNASPLVVGLGDGANYLASDIPAILQHTRRVVFLDEGQMVVLRRSGATFQHIATGAPFEPKVQVINWTPAMAEKGGYRHFMLKEIHEQPRAVTDTLRERVRIERGTVELDGLNLTDEQLAGFSRAVIIACGTSWHAGLVGEYLIEQFSRLPVEVELASEFRYREPCVDEKVLVIAVSQSGETADTLAAIKETQSRGSHVLAVCNVVGSSIVRLSNSNLMTHAGPEVSVASTKAFTTQIAALYLLAVKLGLARGTLQPGRAAVLLQDLIEVPSAIETVLETPASEYVALARRFGNATSMLYLGRGTSFPIALEGALKTKELSYIHAEGYAAGEMKHGPIALIDESVPSVVVCPMGPHFDKTLSNVAETRARGGAVIAVTTPSGAERIGSDADAVLVVPEAPDHVMAFLTAIPMQLLAYHIADFKGTDVDQPRNLAKSVTVE
ncbi:MAG: glutamine--fructose-6-phosphate transaminase (isomerizing) [Myxococcales bacterium]|nr:glutamine--fructose-6-phosphate transaminase (isomerizing) [Myxococcales bacterium]